MNPVLQQAGELHRKRLLPAVLKTDGVEGRKNAHVFNSWVIAKGLNLSAMTPQAISDQFYDAVVADVEAEHPQLLWEVAPKALLKRAEQTKGPVKVADPREASTFEQKIRTSEKSDAEQKAQEQAKRRCLGLVERFAPIRRGRLQYDLRDTKQKEWRDQIAKAKDFISLERAIVKEQQETYDKLERAEQRL